MTERIAAVFSLGNTAGGCEFALRKIVVEYGTECDLYFLYGKPFAGQKGPTPLDAWTALRGIVEFQELRWMAAEATDSASIDQCYKDAASLIRQVNAAGYRKVFVGITGGTNAMVAALFHAAMTELTGEVIPLYVQGKDEISVEMFAAAQTRERILVDRVLEMFAGNRIGAAEQAAAELPAVGAAGFVKTAIGAFAAWDRFDYELAAPVIEGLMGVAEAYASLPHLRPVAEAVVRYGRFARQVAALEAMYREPEKFYVECEGRGFGERVKGQGYHLPADALANAQRRLNEEAGSDAVLRAYRAVEIAVQTRLFGLGVHPSRLRWDRAPLAAVASAWEEKFGTLAEEVSFERGVRLLELLTGESLEAGFADRRYLQNIRNHSYLEHGYVRVKTATARNCVEKAKGLCEGILGRKLELEERRLG